MNCKGGKRYFRRLGWRDPKKRVLLVCEGKKTEPNYFKSLKKDLKLTSVNIEIAGAKGKALELVRYAIGRRVDEFDVIWCVFDKDDCTEDQFREALKLAKTNKLSVAYSNESFELWLILHFTSSVRGVKRKDYGNKLTSLLGKSYNKNKDYYFDVLSKQDTAIKNAEILLRQYPKPNPFEDTPSTTVVNLVKELKELAKN